MPPNAVIVSAVFEKAADEYPITVNQANGGTFTLTTGAKAPTNESTTAQAGATVTLSAAPDSGNRFGRFTLGGASLGDSAIGRERTFTMPAGPVTVSAEFPVKGGGDAKSKFHMYIAFGQSNMAGDNGQQWDAYYNHKLPPSYDERFRLLEATENAWHDRQQNQWYPARPPLVPSGAIGPVDYFGRYLAENTPEDITIGVVIVAVGGVALDVWSPDRERMAEDYKDNKNPYYADSYFVQMHEAGTTSEWWVNHRERYTHDGNIYKRMMELGKMAQEVGVIKGILVHQGESSGGDTYGGWEILLEFIYDQLLEDLGLAPASIPLLAAQPATWDGKTHTKNRLDVLDFNDPANGYPSQFRGIYALDFMERGGLVSDNTHLTNASQKKLGTRFGEKMFELVYNGK
jgi:hypothetical protein